MPNNNNAGMHYVHFPSERSALHEFDYDNQVGSRIGKKVASKRKQTSMWSSDGDPVDLKASIRRYQKEKIEFAKKQAAEKKKVDEKKVSKATGLGIDSVKHSSKKKESHVTTKIDKKTKSGSDKMLCSKKRVTKGSNRASQEQAVARLSESALGNDPRFKDLFASLKE